MARPLEKFEAKLTTFRLGADTREMLEELSKLYGGNKTQVIEELVYEAYSKIEKTKIKKL